MTNIIEPNCRYGHGNLRQITINNKFKKWAYVSQNNPTITFSGNLYSCDVCGYTELFDEGKSMYGVSLRDKGYYPNH